MPFFCKQKTNTDDTNRHELSPPKEIRMCACLLEQQAIVRALFLCRLLIIRVKVGGFALVFGRTLFQEGSDALEIVSTLIDPGAVGIDALEIL